MKKARKSISKKIRFDVFKRDGFECAYCGSGPPAVLLEIDHIDPVSLGGKNDINNLITACFDCNRGKRNIPLEKVPAKLSENMALLKEKEDQINEYRKFIKAVRRREKKDINEISEIYSEAYEDWQLSEKFKKTSIRKFLSLLPKHEIEDAFYIAIDRFPDDPDSVISYFCGVCWRKIKRGGDNE